MKRKLLLILLLGLILPVRVLAASLGTTITGASSITTEEKFTVTISATNASNLWGFRAPLTYDKDKLELVSSAGQNGFTATVGTNIVVDAVTGKSGTVKVATLTFKAKTAFAVGEKTTISLETVEGSDGTNTIEGTGTSKTITMSAPKNSNNDLKTLTITPGTITFDKTKTDYSVTVENSVDVVTISATTEDEKAKISGTGSKTLEIYNNELSVVVTAENGSKKTYTITVIRKDVNGNTKELSTNNKLSNITITDYTVPFNTEIMEYTILLSDTTNELVVNATPSDSSATVTVNYPESYKYGNNIVTINVLSENGQESTYKINAIKLDTVSSSNKSTNEGINIGIVVIMIILFTALGVFCGYFIASKLIKRKK